MRARETTRDGSRATLAVALSVFLAAPSLWAAPKMGNAAAEHVAAANRAYKDKNYDKALEELRAGYRLAPRAEFLLTFAQIYRAAGKLQQALEACNSYLATMPNGALAPGARELADALRSEIAAAAPPPAPPPPVVAQPTPPPVVAPPVAPAPIVSPFAPSVTATAPPPEHHRQALAWGLGVGAVVVVGLAVGLGVGLGVDHERSSTFGTVKFNP